MRIVDVNDLPQWVKDLRANQPTPRFMPGLWTVDEQGDYHMWSTLGSFHRCDLKGKAPKGVDPDDVVDWYDLPAWIKGSYSTEAEMLRLQALTWVKGSESTYFAYDEKGKYIGIWERE